jgi:hypothetical protein
MAAAEGGVRTRKLVLTYISGDCGGLFLDHCCRVKRLDGAREDLVFEARSLKHGMEKAKSVDGAATSGNTESMEDGVIATSGKLPMLECSELGLSCSGVLVCLQALDSLFPEICLVHGTPVERINTLSQLADLHDFHKLESMVASAHGRSEVPKLHGRLNVVTFSSPQDAVSKRKVMHLLEAEILASYNTTFAGGMRTPPPPGSGVAYSVTDMYLFWIIAANFVARKAEKDLNDYPSVVKLISDMRGYPEISSIYDAEVSSVQSRFRVCSTLGKGRKSDVSELNTNSPLTGAINQLKLLAAGLHLSAHNEQRVQSVIRALSVGESLLTPNILKQIAAGAVNLDKDTESWLQSELAGKSHDGDPNNTLPRSASEASQKSMPRPTTPGKPSYLGSVMPSKDQKIVAELQGKIGTWDLDIIEDFKALNERPLFFVCLCAARRNGLSDAFADIRTGDPGRKVPVMQRFFTFLTALEAKYINNHYHNACHAADVVNTMTCLLSDGKSENELTVLQRMSAVIASAAHDVGHTGQNNNFHKSSLSKFAVQYSDQSVMEMHHLATAFQLLQREDMNMFSALSREDYSTCRHLIIEMILSTDLAKHFSLINNYNITLDSKGIISSNMLLEIVLKAADLGHAVKPFDIHHRWSMLVSVRGFFFSPFFLFKLVLTALSLSLSIHASVSISTRYLSMISLSISTASVYLFYPSILLSRCVCVCVCVCVSVSLHDCA